MTTKNTAIAVTSESAEATTALVLKITEANLVPANDAPIVAAVVENHNAQLHRVLALIEEFDLSARAVACLYKTRDSSEYEVSLSSLAKAGQAFSELSASGEPEEIATEIDEACMQVMQAFPHRRLYAHTILETAISVGGEDGMSFRQAVDAMLNSPIVQVSEDGEIIFVEEDD
jgi:hypothetical protein